MKKSNQVFLICLLAFLLPPNLKTAAQQNSQNKPREKGAVVFELPGTANVIVKKILPINLLQVLL